MEDDSYLPWNTRAIPALSREAGLSASEGDPAALRNGIDRSMDGADNGWTGRLGAWVEYRFGSAERVRRMRFVFDSHLDRREQNMPCIYPLGMEPVGVPATLVRAFRVEALDDNGAWTAVARVDDNHQRVVRLEADVRTCAVRFIPESTWGAESAHVFAWDVDDRKP